MAISPRSFQSLLLRLRFDGQELSTATGFVARGAGGSPQLVTNRHVFTGRDQRTKQPLSDTGGIPNEVVIVHNREDAPGEWVERIERLEDEDGRPTWYGHPVLGEHADLAALSLRNLDGVELHYVELSEAHDPAIQFGPGEIVSVIGFPFGRTVGKSYPIWATGFVASEPEIDFEATPVFLIGCRSRPGQSGSPVVAYRRGSIALLESGIPVGFPRGEGRFLGVYSGRIRPDSDIGMVWKAAAVKDLLWWQADF